jgi:N-acetylmuramic acid 6-phosphate etherase
MISTATMVRLGHVYKNLMIDLKATNEKLVARQLGIISEVCECDTEKANELLNKYGTVKKAIFAHISNIECPNQVEEILARNNYHIQNALKEIK